MFLSSVQFPQFGLEGSLKARWKQNTSSNQRLGLLHTSLSAAGGLSSVIQGLPAHPELKTTKNNQTLRAVQQTSALRVALNSTTARNTQVTKFIIVQTQHVASRVNVFKRLRFAPFSDASNPSSSSVCPLPSVFLIQGLFTALLALTNSLLMLLIVPQLLHTSGVHRVLVYLDPGFSLLAVITLITTTAPQVKNFHFKTFFFVTQALTQVFLTAPPPTGVQVRAAAATGLAASPEPV